MPSQPGPVRSVASLVLLVAILWSAVETTAQPTLDPSPRFRSLTVDDGLPNYTVMDLLGDGNGYVWVGTQIGLSRFDGSRFRVYRGTSANGDSLGDGFVTALARVDRDPGSVWVGTKLAGVYRYHPGSDSFSPITVPDVPEARHILSLLDVGGILLAGTDGAGLLMAVPGDTTLASALPMAATGASVSEIVAIPGQRDAVLLLSELGLTRFDIPTVTATSTSITGDMPGTPTSLVWDSSGQRALVGSPHGLFELQSHGPDGTTFSSRKLLGLASSDVRRLLVKGEDVWVGFGDTGVQVLDDQLRPKYTLTHAASEPSSLADDTIQSLYLDPSGAVWVGTWGNGFSVERRPQRFAQVSHQSGHANSPPPSNVFGFREDRTQPGSLWIGFLHGGIAHWDVSGGRFRRFYQHPDHPLNSVSALEYDHDGGLWALGRRNTVFRLALDASVLSRVPLDLPPDSADGWVTFMHPRRVDRTLLIGTRGHGLIVYNPDTDSVERRYGRRAAMPDHRLTSDDIWQLVEAPDGGLWVATGLGLVYIDPSGRVAEMHTHNPDDVQSLSGPLVSSVVQDGRGYLWLGTPDAGLNRFDLANGLVRRFTGADGLPSGDVGGIIQDEAGRLWLSSSRGLAVLDTETLEIARFGPEDGLLEQTFQYRARTRLASGQIALGGPNGTITLFDPLAVTIDSSRVRPVVSEVLLGDGRVPPDELDDLSVGFRNSDITFRFASLTFSSPEKTRFRIRLSGDDAGWAVVQDSEVRYRRLAPDTYSFEVMASNGDGLWGPPSAPLTLTVRPPFWQTWWFSALVLALIAGLTATGFQYRIAQIRRLEAERNRIADDLHDDLGSKLGSLALRLDLLARQLPSAEAPLRGLASFSRQAIQNLRDTIWLVGTGRGALRDLRERLENASAEILVTIEYSFTSVGGPMGVEMDPLRRRAFLLAFRESLHNVAKHSGASLVEIRFLVSSRVLEVVVRDNGIGLNQESGSGRGMHTLVHRMESIGGEAIVESEPKHGTEVRLRAQI